MVSFQIIDNLLYVKITLVVWPCQTNLRNHNLFWYITKIEKKVRYGSHKFWNFCHLFIKCFLMKYSYEFWGISWMFLNSKAQYWGKFKFGQSWDGKPIFVTWILLREISFINPKNFPNSGFLWGSNKMPCRCNWPKIIESQCSTLQSYSSKIVCYYR